MDRKQHSNSKRRILVIEDNSDLARLIIVILGRAGFDTALATNGVLGIQDSEERKFDLILSDVDLPDMTGFEVCRRIKQNPLLQFTPIILMSGRYDGQNETTALECGASAFLNKPFQAECLIKEICEHLR